MKSDSFNLKYCNLYIDNYIIKTNYDRTMA